MLYLTKIRTHLLQAELNARKSQEFREKGDVKKSDHYQRIAEAHLRNAQYYRRHSQSVSLAMAF
jgi:hypothetical protein